MKEPIYYNENDKKSLKGYTWLGMGAIVLMLVLLLIFGEFLVPMKVDGVSMTPTLSDGQVVYVQKILYKIDYGDIVVFEREGGDAPCIKRVMGKPGDKLIISNGRLYRNSEQVDDPYSDGHDMVSFDSGRLLLNEQGELELKIDEYFYLGDNRSDSLDSRIYGGVTKKNIIGKMVI